ncbi:MAG TPA: DUF1566 domain-containing protein [Pontiella sp.]
MKTMIMSAAAGLAICTAYSDDFRYPVVDTGQLRCYSDQMEMACPERDKPFFGQDAQYSGNRPSYRDNGDGTVTDLVTGLMWQSDPGEKKTYDDAVAGASKCRTGGHEDWRLPTIKELYSLINFSGIDPDPRSGVGATPFIDTDVFKFQYGKEEDGDRIIDSQWATSTLYEGEVMHGQQAMFGVNFADGRIKGYPVGSMPGRGAKTFYVIYVRGNPEYGKNDFVDNSDGTVTDRATGLMWMKTDSGKGMDWEAALHYAESFEVAGQDDWRLPNAKELQSIVDYTRSPDTSRSAAIDPVFECTAIRNEDGKNDWGHYWTSTTHADPRGGSRAVYFAFGRALGFMHSEWMDVHGAGAQRSDPKSGDESELPKGHGPQGDVQRINNYVRLVRGGTAEPNTSGPAIEPKPVEQRGGFVGRLDRDGDSRVSRSEFDGPSDHFDTLDKDSDGFLSESEAPPPPGVR